ncbi:MAG: GreA/GreB family elongation factor, partial [Planctomycetes bacterium]|nr:GreA/GreB family elongation factor [Planctomycetota bacterium]
EMSFTFLGPWDADHERQIYSYLAPFARSFLGRTVGEEVEARLDGGPRVLKIVRIEYAEGLD